MIGRLRGTVVEVREGYIILDVGGVGYVVAVRRPAQFSLGTEAELHTHLAVRESALDLYGFELRDELEMFLHLLKIPKIGPKSAMQIMTQADLELLTQAVINGDPSYLSKMSGIGKKSAEKIVLGLKDSFEGIEFAFGSAVSEGDSDVVDALIALGYSQQDAREALKKLPPEVTSTNDRVREALKQIGL